MNPHRLGCPLYLHRIPEDVRCLCQLDVEQRGPGAESRGHDLVKARLTSRSQEGVLTAEDLAEALFLGVPAGDSLLARLRTEVRGEARERADRLEVLVRLVEGEVPGGWDQVSSDLLMVAHRRLESVGARETLIRTWSHAWVEGGSDAGREAVLSDLRGVYQQLRPVRTMGEEVVRVEAACEVLSTTATWCINILRHAPWGVLVVPGWEQIRRVRPAKSQDVVLEAQDALLMHALGTSEMMALEAGSGFLVLCAPVHHLERLDASLESSRNIGSRVLTPSCDARWREVTLEALALMLHEGRWSQGEWEECWERAGRV